MANKWNKRMAKVKPELPPDPDEEAPPRPEPTGRDRWIPRIVQGRELYACCECGVELPPGEEHELCSGRFDVNASPWLVKAAMKDAEAQPKDDDPEGADFHWLTFRTCRLCAEARKKLADKLKAHIDWGLLAEKIKQHTDHDSILEFAKGK